MRLMVRWLAILTVLLAAACDSAVIEPTATPPPSPPIETTAPADPTTAPTRQPVTTEATPFFGRSVPPGRNAATFRILHAAQEAPTLDVYLDGAEYARSLGQNLSTGLTPVLPGTYTLHVEPRGEDTVLAETPVTLAAGRTTDVIVVSGEDGLQLMIVEGPDETVDPGIALVRTVNALPNSGRLQAVLNGSTIPAEMAMGEASAFSRFEQGDLAVSIQRDGTEILAENRRVRELTYMLLVVTGTAERPQLLVQEAPLSSRYSLRVINASADAREIDVYFDDALVAGGLGYGGATERTLYANTPSTVSVHAANADLAVSTPLIDGYAINPRAGSSATLAIYGTADDLRAMWIEDDLSPVPVGKSRVRFAHVVPSTSTLRAGVNSSDLEDLQPFNYGSASAPVYFDGGEQRLFFRDANEADDVIELRQAVPLAEGRSILYFVTGAQIGDETPPLMFEETVSVDETLSSEPIGPRRGQYRVRFVNAIVSQPLIDVEQEGQIAATNLRYGEGTELITLSLESVVMNAHMSTSGAVLVDQHIGFPRPGDYTVYIVGTPDSGITAALIDDEPLQAITNSEQAPSVRLVNLSRDPDAIFGLALAPVRSGDSTPVPTLQPAPTVANPDGIDLGRPRLPIGMPVPIVGVEGIGASRQVLTQARAETTVINQSNEIVAALGVVEYLPGTHTDIVVYEYRTATETLATAFALVYPLR